MRAEEARRRGRRIWVAVTAGAVVVIAAAVGISLAATHGTGNGSRGTPGSTTASLSTLGTLKPPPAGALGPEGVPVPAAPSLAGPTTAVTGQHVDGISCERNEQTLFHIHAHLAVFVSGTPRQVPAGIGIPGAQAQNTARGPFIGGGTCFYWLHTRR